MRMKRNGFVMRVEHTRLPKCAMFGELLGGAGCVGVQENGWMGCLLDDLRAFGINADQQWMTTAQDEGEWHQTVEHGAGLFMAEYIVAEKVRAGLRHAVVSMVEHDGKDPRQDSPKQACSCWFARHC